MGYLKTGWIIMLVSDLAEVTLLACQTLIGFDI